MIRFCPNCNTERPLGELFCEGTAENRRCEWNLSDEPIRQAGWRPEPIVTAEQVSQDAVQPTCINGHALDPFDLICMTCGADRAATPEPEHTQSQPEFEPEQDDVEPTQETVIDAWRLLRQIGSTPRVRDRYVAMRVDGEQQAVLTLYHHGAEPDPSVYEVLKRLPREHVPEIYAAGRWNDRAYEVTEQLTGGSLVLLCQIKMLASDHVGKYNVIC
jgi:hypothetical protein